MEKITQRIIKKHKPGIVFPSPTIKNLTPKKLQPTSLPFLSTIPYDAEIQELTVYTICNPTIFISPSKNFHEMEY